MSSSNGSDNLPDRRYGDATGPMSPSAGATNPFHQEESTHFNSGGGIYHSVSRGDRQLPDSEMTSSGPANSSMANLHVPLLGGPMQEPHQRRFTAGSDTKSIGGETPSTVSSRSRMSRHIAPAALAANAAAFSSVSQSMRFSSASEVPPSAPSHESHFNYGGVNTPEPDDWLHNPDPIKDRHNGGGFRDSTGHMFTLRGCMNMGTLAILALALIMLFGGYPILDALLSRPESTKGGFNLGGANSTGQMFDGIRGLIDPDTPQSAYDRLSVDGKTRLKLVFSDEFETAGRSFYPGEDPFFEAVSLHYWGTTDYEWYDPAAVTTADGNLVITLSEMELHNLNFRSAMIQSWNKFCFTGGVFEARVLLPGSHDISGLWPGIWTMGNLGRAGYGATNDGMWPYTYDTCDVGTLPNQTYPASQGGGPPMALTTGGDHGGQSLSFLPGQRLSRCTCPDSDDHPGPKHEDGSWVGRSAPELDLIEAAASNTPGEHGHASMSLQLAPFNAGYNLTTGPDSYQTLSPRAKMNTYRGGRLQQAASGISSTSNDGYADSRNPRFERYSFEYEPGVNGWVEWMIEDERMWRLGPDALAPDPRVEISRRPVPEEVSKPAPLLVACSAKLTPHTRSLPMYLILNLGLSSAFTYVNFDKLVFPATMRVDYVRVYQPEDRINVGCDTPSHPTAAYIEKHKEAYTNPNLTTFTEPRARGGYNRKFPGNRLKGEC